MRLPGARARRFAHAAGGGWPSNCGSVSLIHAQAGAIFVHMVACGAAVAGSSSVPTRMKIKCGRESASLNMAVPQDGQNVRCMRLPLSAVLT